MFEQILNRKIVVIILCIVFTLIFGFIDYLTGYEFNFFVFYYVSIALVSWRFKIQSAILISIFSIIVWMIADILAGHNYSSIIDQIWNTLMRFISFLIIAIAITRLRDAVTREKKVSDDLRNTLAKIKTLEGLLPICAHCKKIKKREGYWEQVEEYISSHSNLKFSHGLCESCARELYGEFYKDKDKDKDKDNETKEEGDRDGT